MNKKYIALLISAFCSVGSIADVTTLELEEVSVKANVEPKYAGSATGDHLKVSDKIVSEKQLKTRSATLGNALASELGVHSDPFGGGASAPIIRGQKGVRVKILQNGSDVVDMAAVSPDHAVAADSLLAKQIELVRGASTLLYSTASPSGIINVVDKRIPTNIPEKGYEGEVDVRLDTASKERAGMAGVTLGGNHVAMRVEGLTRHSDNYKVPSINLGKTVRHVPDTHSKSKVGTIGLSLVGDSGYIGASYSQRKDKYGLPGHNHAFDNCSAHITDSTGTRYGFRYVQREYLYVYPHLMDSTDIIESPHFHCGDSHSHNGDINENNPFGFDYDHDHPGPWVELTSKRWDLRGEWKQPFKAIDRIRINAALVDYKHRERDYSPTLGTTDHAVSGIPVDGKAPAFFKNRGVNYRIEIDHAPLGNLTGTWGFQYQTQKASAFIPTERNQGERYPLVPHTNKQVSLFGVEQYRWNNFIFELGVRAEKQKTPVHYDMKRLEPYIKQSSFFLFSPPLAQPDLSAYKEKAVSYSGSVEWFFDDVHRLSFMYSHNERIPSPMELYYHGKHLATSSFMFGNKELMKEKSNNFEIGIDRMEGPVNYKLSVYHNRFDNYIYTEDLWREGNLFMRRYTQSKAKFYGAEGEVSYNFLPRHKVTIFGDIITGKVSDLSNIYGDKIYERIAKPCEGNPNNTCYENVAVGQETIERPDTTPPRLPPARLGLRLNSEFNEHWSAFAEYAHVFKQEKVSVSVSSKRKSRLYNDDPPLEPVYVRESKTAGYNLVNLGVDYTNKWNDLNYTVSVNANNLLNETIYIHTSYLPFVPQMGRNFVLGLHVDF
ncbi:TonB-dependent receptor [Otariodibacter oris]|uniref:Iron complex outermembrane receptor protein n=1 Tax=Otariodibacter oris TaxID=1032623 RepID=A0A420XGB7_9PAST|nr:TonB-dependent receptor [Otariodibacter oris]QGM80062.1 hypothetical protein A6A10_00875 [Otariodibacter oris]RKR71887.1 iron complex outermembrane receptor protein [Otariodibacter oris]